MRTILFSVIIALAVFAQAEEAPKSPPTVAVIDGEPIYKVLEPGAIPAIENPTFVTGEAADGQMKPGEPVMGVVIKGEAHAYSLWQLDAHEIVKQMPGKALVWGVAQGPHAAALTNETVGASKVASFSLGEVPAIALQGADGGVRAFVTRAGGHTLNLIFTEDGVLKDAATSSVWDPTTGIALEGKLAGTQLEELPVTRVYWFAWSSFYPNTLVVD